MTLLDLTRPMDHPTLVALAGRRVAEPPGVEGIVVEPTRSWERGDNWVHCRWTLNEHFGTHLDSPSHVIDGGQFVDEVELDRLFGEAVVLDCSHAQGRAVTADDLERARPAVRSGDIVIIYSAEPPGTLDRFITDQTYVSLEAAEWLVHHQVSAVGVEAASLEHVHQRLLVDECYRPEVDEPWPAHRICLSNSVYIIEGLTNLESIVGTRVQFCALPLRVPGATGSPVRAVAWPL